LKTKLIILSLLIASVQVNIHAQIVNPFYQSIINNVSYDSILHNLQNFESLGVKIPGTLALNNTKDRIISKYSWEGYNDISIDTFSSSGNTFYNIVITKTGVLHPDTFVIVDGHYDTHVGTGTNDNGSGTSIIMEIARLLKNVSTEYSIRFIHFSAEELGLVGSEHYVSNVVIPQNMKIRLVLNIDEVGGVAGYPNDTIKCESDQSYPFSNNAISAAYTDTLVSLTHLYSSLHTQITNAYGSDYVPFQQNGNVITGLYEYNKSNYVHTSGDFLSHLDTSYVYEIAKASVAATLYFARAYSTTVGLSNVQQEADKICIYPNPFNDQIFINTSGYTERRNFILFTTIGKFILSKEFNSSCTVDLPWHKACFYFYLVTDDSGGVIKSGKLIGY
jgi:aminopeptidase YwaD